MLARQKRLLSALFVWYSTSSARLNQAAAPTEPTRHRPVTPAMPLKICFINPLGYSLFFPESSGEDRFGGAEIQLYNIAVELAKDKEYEVTTLVEAPRNEELGTQASVRLLGVKPIHSLTDRLRARIPSLSWNYFQALNR